MRSAERSTVSGRNTSSGVRRSRVWSPDDAPQTAGVLLEGLSDVGVPLLGVAEGREPHDRPVQVTVDFDARDRHHGQPFIVDLLHGLGDYAPDELAHPGGAVAGPDGRAGSVSLVVSSNISGGC